MAIIDCDTSMTRTMVARSRGTLSMPLGRAHAPMSVTRLSSASATVTCRSHCDCFGRTIARTDVFVNRMPADVLRLSRTMYAAMSSGMNRVSETALRL